MTPLERDNLSLRVEVHVVSPADTIGLGGNKGRRGALKRPTTRIAIYGAVVLHWQRYWSLSTLVGLAAMCSNIAPNAAVAAVRETHGI